VFTDFSQESGSRYRHVVAHSATIRSQNDDFGRQALPETSVGCDSSVDDASERGMYGETELDAIALRPLCSIWLSAAVGGMEESSPRIALCTIIAKNYLANARTLMSSVREHHPEIARSVLLVDSVDRFFDPDTEDFHIDLSSALPIPHNRLFHFKYSVLELSTAVKPYYLDLLFEERGFDVVLYCDPDIVLYDRLAPVLDALQRSIVVLTPHLTGPLEDGRLPGEREIMQSGAYNLGFIGLRRSEETMRFLHWWQRKLYNDCISDIGQNLFVDQRWIDLVPGMFDGIAILRDPGLNVAYWNLPLREVAEREGKYRVNGVSLRFFHFSGYRIDHPASMSRYEDRYTDALPAPLDVLFDSYRTQLLANGHADASGWPFAYGAFPDGAPIPDICRRIVRDDPRLQARFAAIQDRDLTSAILEWMNSPWDDWRNGQPLITQLAGRIYQRRNDVRAVFADVVRADRAAFAHWFISDGARQYHLSRSLLEPVAASLDVASDRIGVWSDQQGVTAYPPPPTLLRVEMSALKRLHTALIEDMQAFGEAHHALARRVRSAAKAMATQEEGNFHE